MNELPQTCSLSYVQARKQGHGRYAYYKLYWIGSRNEVFPGELFNTVAEARQYYKVQIIKQAQAKEQAS